MVDENGFKCHMTSDSHLRQMQIFRSNAGGMMDSFSREFEVSYLETLRRRHGTQRMNANNVYQEVIQDKHHIHMNSTKWASLSDFVQYIGKKGLVVVEETERGWYVTYIERDPALLARQEALKKKTEADQREEKIAAERRDVLRMEAAKALDRAGCAVERKASEIGNLEERGEKMEMKLGISSMENGEKKKKRKNKVGGKISLLEDEDEEEEESEEMVMDVASKANDFYNKQPTPRLAEVPKVVPKRELEQHNNTETNKETKKRKPNEDDDKANSKKKDYWLYRDIFVRIISKKLANGEYYKRKAIVDKVIDKYEAEIEVLESSYKAKDGGDIVSSLNYCDLETYLQYTLMPIIKF